MLFFSDKKASDKAAEASARKNLQFLNEPQVLFLISPAGCII